jgi:hypothetical protein
VDEGGPQAGSMGIGNLAGIGRDMDFSLAGIICPEGSITPGLPRTKTLSLEKTFPSPARLILKFRE